MKQPSIGACCVKPLMLGWSVLLAAIIVEAMKNNGILQVNGTQRIVDPLRISGEGHCFGLLIFYAIALLIASFGLIALRICAILFSRSSKPFASRYFDVGSLSGSAYVTIKAGVLCVPNHLFSK